MSGNVLTFVAAATICTVMFTLGLGIALGEFRWLWKHPALLARGLFAVLIAVPAMAVVIVQALELPRWTQIGIVLMAIAPGAPVALRRSLEAGGHRSFAPALQILVALLAAGSMPLSIAVLNPIYEGRASLPPASVAWQVLTAQLAPLAAGMLVRRYAPITAVRIEPAAARVAIGLLIVLLVLALLAAWRAVIEAGVRTEGAIVLVTAAALAVGHLLGGPEPATRTAVAISSAARNASLALLVAALNGAPPEVGRTVLVYLVVSAVTVVPYAVWRRRAAPAGAATPKPEGVLR